MSGLTVESVPDDRDDGEPIPPGADPRDHGWAEGGAMEPCWRDRVRIWVMERLWRYCTACDVIYRSWDRRHRSCHCGISRPDTWTDADRAAFGTIIDAAKRATAAKEEER